MNKITQHTLGIMAVVITLSAGSGAWAETGATARTIVRDQKQRTSETLTRLNTGLIASPSAADLSDGDPRLLRELIEQGERELSDAAAQRALLASVHADLTASARQ